MDGWGIRTFYFPHHSSQMLLHKALFRGSLLFFEERRSIGVMSMRSLRRLTLPSIFLDGCSVDFDGLFDLLLFSASLRLSFLHILRHLADCLGPEELRVGDG